MASHRVPAHAAAAAPTSMPVTERLADSTIILPLYHEITDDDLDRVCAVIARSAEQGVPGADDRANQNEVCLAYGTPRPGQRLDD